MQLHTPKRRDGSDRMYCGAAALCAITGENYESVRARLNFDRGRKENQGITGSHGFELLRVLSMFGYISLERGYDFACKPMNLNQYLSQRPPLEKNNILLIELTSHFVTVKGDKLVDNHTKIPVHIAIAPWKRCKVESVWIIKRKG